MNRSILALLLIAAVRPSPLFRTTASAHETDGPAISLQRYENASFADSVVILGGENNRTLSSPTSPGRTSIEETEVDWKFTSVKTWAQFHVNHTASHVLFVIFMDHVYGQAAGCYARHMKRAFGVSLAMTFYGSVPVASVNAVDGIHMSCVVAQCNRSVTFDDYFGSHHGRSTAANQFHTRLSLFRVLVNSGLAIPFVISDADIVWLRFPLSLVRDLSYNDFVCTKEFVYIGKKRRMDLNVGVMGGHTGRALTRAIFNAFAENWKQSGGVAWEQDIVNHVYPMFLHNVTGFRGLLLPLSLYRYFLPCRWALQANGKPLGKRRNAQFRQFVTAHFAGSKPIVKRKCLGATWG